MTKGLPEKLVVKVRILGRKAKEKHTDLTEGFNFHHLDFAGGEKDNATIRVYGTEFW